MRNGVELTPAMWKRPAQAKKRTLRYGLALTFLFFLAGPVFQFARLFKERVGNLRGRRKGANWESLPEVYWPPAAMEPEAAAQICRRLGAVSIAVALTPEMRRERDLYRWLVRTFHKRVNAGEPASLFFIIGQVGLPQDMLSSLREENAVEEDIILGNFTELYENLPQKQALLMRFFAECKNPKARILLKNDADTMVNWRAFFDRMRCPRAEGFWGPHLYVGDGERCRKEGEPKILGAILPRIRVKLEPRSKFYDGGINVGRKKKWKFYPPYPTGAAVVFSKEATVLLNERWKKSSLHYRMDDAVLGLLLKDSDICMFHWPGFVDSPKANRFRQYYRRRTRPSHLRKNTTLPALPCTTAFSAVHCNTNSDSCMRNILHRIAYPRTRGNCSHLFPLPSDVGFGAAE